MKLSLSSSLESHPVRWIVCISLLLPLYFSCFGYFGDDFSFHLASWMGILQDWRSGVLFPSWLAGANFSLGEPRFYFYPPLSTWTGALLLLLLPDRFAPGFFCILVTGIAGFSMLRLARALAPEQAGKCAVLFCTSFYLVITLLLRYAIAEALAAAFLPLLLLHYVRLTTSQGQVVEVKLSLLIALTWLTNIPAAIVVSYVLFLTSLVWSVLQRQLRPVLLFLLAEALGLGLSSFYLLPALVAKGQVAANAIQQKFPWQDYTLFHHPHNPLARSLTYPLWFWSLAGVALVVYAMRSGQALTPTSSPHLRQRRLIALSSCLPLLFQLPQSGLLWSFLPELRLVGFSFRFLCFLAIGLSLFLPLLRSRTLRRCSYGVWILFLCLPFTERIARFHVHGPVQTLAAVQAELTPGFRGYEEYLPLGLTDPPGPQPLLPLRASPQPACHSDLRRWDPQNKQFDSYGSGACTYLISLSYFPEWHAFVDGSPSNSLSRTAEARLQIVVPPGRHSITLLFERPLTPLLLGLVLTLGSALVLTRKRFAWPPAAPGTNRSLDEVACANL